ncbi:hypothetical protein [Methylotenera sp.]|uniref:hypothetical protein n=1 Tax=Methylotenera sp. TaxID=2051956 RepID=UPI0027351809|nr:hypothetical protein [Methylotenera sp.]MDP3778391.1 hypothetical protein [Methylotenera sp.]
MKKKNKLEKFNNYQDISVKTFSPEYINDQKSITIVINYPDFYENGFTGIFELRLLDVDEPNPETQSLYYDTIREVWEDNLDWWNEPMESISTEYSLKGGK